MVFCFAGGSAQAHSSPPAATLPFRSVHIHTSACTSLPCPPPSSLVPPTLNPAGARVCGQRGRPRVHLRHAHAGLLRADVGSGPPAGRQPPRAGGVREQRRHVHIAAGGEFGEGVAMGWWGRVTRGCNVCVCVCVFVCVYMCVWRGCERLRRARVERRGGVARGRTEPARTAGLSCGFPSLPFFPFCFPYTSAHAHTKTLTLPPSLPLR